MKVERKGLLKLLKEPS